MLFAIVRDIARFFEKYAIGGSRVAIFGVACFAFICLIFKKNLVLSSNENVSFGKKQFVARMIWVYLFLFYLYIVIGITVLSRSESGTRFVSFELFRIFRNTFQARKQIYENVIMFVPYSILLFGLSKHLRKWWVMLLVGAGSSLLIEVMQWVTHTGYFELDDILTNTIGMLLGYALAYFISKLKDKIRIRRIG